MMVIFGSKFFIILANLRGTLVYLGLNCSKLALSCHGEDCLVSSVNQEIQANRELGIETAAALSLFHFCLIR